MIILPEFYETNLKRELGRAEYLLLKILINLEQQTVFKKALPLFNNYKTVVLGDREFCSSYLANWLTEQKVYFCLRIKKDAFIKIESEIWLQLKDLGLAPGMSFFYQGIKYTKSSGFVSFNLAAKWKRKRLGVAPEDGWFILTNLDDLDSAIKAYKQRFDIEEMFRDFKSGGYNLEETNVSGQRLISLILLISLAYTAATISGQKIKRIGVQKYVGRIKESGRNVRRHSSFYIGLYGETALREGLPPQATANPKGSNWVNFIEETSELVAQLLILNPNKLPCYQQGQRAMRLILSAF